MRGTDYWQGSKTLSEMNASHLMERAVQSFRESSSARDLAEAMVKGNFGCVPIVNEARRLIGVVTEFDLLKVLSLGKDLGTMVASAIMSAPICISEQMTAEEIVALLQARHLVRVPVVDADGRLSGVVARRDFLAGYLEATSGPLPSL